LHSENQIPAVSIRVTTSRDQASVGLKFIPTKALGLLSGTIIRGTLIQGPNRPQNAKRNQAIGPTTPKSCPNPKEAQSSLSLRPSSVVRPIRGPLKPAEAISASLEASPPRPSTAHHISASLEGSGPTLGRAGQLRLGRALRRASAQGETLPRSRLPLGSWN